MALPKRPPARTGCRRAKRRHWRRAPTPRRGFPVADARPLIGPPHSGGSRYHHSLCACPITSRRFTNPREPTDRAAKRVPGPSQATLLTACRASARSAPALTQPVICCALYYTSRANLPFYAAHEVCELDTSLRYTHRDFGALARRWAIRTVRLKNLILRRHFTCQIQVGTLDANGYDLRDDVCAKDDSLAWLRRRAVSDEWTATIIGYRHGIGRR
jgi:hypothetical protein